MSPIVNLHVAGKIIGTTAEHPFFVKARGWLACRQLDIGDELLAADGEWLPVEGVAHSGEVTTVYNLRVADYHTYFVGGEEWGWSLWAHNAKYRVTRKLLNRVRSVFPRVSDAVATRIARLIPTKQKIITKAAGAFQHLTTPVTKGTREVASIVSSLAAKMPKVFGTPDRITLDDAGQIAKVSETKYMGRALLVRLGMLADKDPLTFLEKGLGKAKHIQFKKHVATIDKIREMAKDPTALRGAVRGVSDNVQFELLLPRFSGSDLPVVEDAIAKMKKVWQAELHIDVQVRYATTSIATIRKKLGQLLPSKKS